MAVHLERELSNLKKKLLHLGSLVETNLTLAIKSLSDLDESLAKDVQIGDKVIDMKEVEVEEDCLKILALHQPVAIDLRFVIATLKINNDLERIGDLAMSIARRARYLSKAKKVEAPYNYEMLAEKTINMVSDALDSLVTLDEKLAFSIMEADDEVDALNREAYKKVYDGIVSNPQNTEQLIDYMNVSRSLERIADYATNIAEDVIYMIDGKIVRHGSDFEAGPSTNI